MVPSSAAAPPKIYEREYYERLRELEERHWWAIGMRHIASRLLAPYLNGRPVRVLDAGCGTGGMLSWLERWTGPASAVGIDISAHALRFCRERRLSRLAQASIMQLPFPDRAFDLVICLDVIQHLPRDGADLVALRECHRVLRPGGVLYLRTNVRTGGAAADGGTPASDGASAPDFHQYQHGELRELFGTAGFSIETLTHANLLPALVATWLRRLKPGHGAEPLSGAYRGLTMRVPPIWLGLPLQLVMYGEAAYLAGGRRHLPWGHTLICVAARSPVAEPRGAVVAGRLRGGS